MRSEGGGGDTLTSVGRWAVSSSITRAPAPGVHVRIDSLVVCEMAGSGDGMVSVGQQGSSTTLAVQDGLANDTPFRDVTSRALAMEQLPYYVVHYWTR